MKNSKIDERTIWADMFRNPEDHHKAFVYAFASALCFAGIIVIRILV